jgi:hypothetical protein
MRIPMNRGYFHILDGLTEEAKKQGCNVMASQSRPGKMLAVPPVGVTIKMPEPVEFGGPLHDGPHLVMRDVFKVKTFTKLVAGDPANCSVWDIAV